MTKVNLRDIPEEEQRSPGGKFRSYCRNLSLALGAVRNTGAWGGSHPFDLQIRRLPPGASVCPFHLHLAQWELFVIRAGEGTVRSGPERQAVRAGDAFIHPPGTPHQLTNTGPGDLEVLIIADNPVLDLCHYPDSDKWGSRAVGVFRIERCDYFSREDETTDGVATPRPNPAPPFPATTVPFAQRRVAVDQLAWEEWRSPRGKYAQFGRQISLALGAVPRAPLTQGGHPFDLEAVRIPAGKWACPFHTHAAQWELYCFTSGRGVFRLGAERFAVEPGDLVLAPPGAAHAVGAAADADVEYLIVADNPPVDIFTYPDSDKWGCRPPGRYFRPVDTPYWDGEE